ncbi:PadR family transcriptional regulator [Cellulomonas sp. 179-A 4D5 NHS]|uniref:PadR family transcriptional regulator n=1 Tax=Cellulomonas sp. 179-A 4D5 NHS TaxID=3142378 RepID=UPI0039A36246
MGELLGGLEASVLRAVSAPDDGPAYGLSVRRAVSVERGREYSIGAIYTTLARLEAKGLVASVASEPVAVRGGRSRREYLITALGQQAMARARTAAARTWGFGITEVTP